MIIYALIGLTLGFLYTMFVGYLVTVEINETRFQPKVEAVVLIFFAIILLWPVMFVGILGFMLGSFINYNKVN